MEKSERIDLLLDAWDQLLDENPQADLDSFVDQRGTDLSDEEQAEFVGSARALAEMNRKLEAVQDTEIFPSDTLRGTKSSTRFPDLGPGHEPMDGFELIERIGAGGFGEVWKARASTDGREKAIKFVPLNDQLGARELEALDEIKDCRHPNLLYVESTLEKHDRLVIVMELAERTLAQRFDEATKEGHDGIPRDELLKNMTDAAKGIDYLAERGIYHRDIKPQNLMIFGGAVKIGDFGLAQSIEYNVAEARGLTPKWASPETIKGLACPQSDQYSLAVTYCYLRVGHMPFEGINRSQSPDLTKLSPQERPAVEKALSSKPKDRWQTCEEFVEALRAACAELPTVTSGEPMPKEKKWIFRVDLKILRYSVGVSLGFGALLLVLGFRASLLNPEMVLSVTPPDLDEVHNADPHLYARVEPLFPAKRAFESGTDEIEAFWKRYRPSPNAAGVVTPLALLKAIADAKTNPKKVSPDILKTKFGRQTTSDLKKIKIHKPVPWFEDWKPKAPRDPKVRELWAKVVQKPWDADHRKNLMNRMDVLDNATSQWLKWARNNKMTWGQLTAECNKLPPSKENIRDVLREWIHLFENKKSWKLLLVRGQSALGKDWGTERTFTVYHWGQFNTTAIGSLPAHPWESHKHHKYSPKDGSMTVGWKPGMPITALLEGPKSYGIKPNMINRERFGPLSLWYVHYIGGCYSPDSKVAIFFRIEACPGPPQKTVWECKGERNPVNIIEGHGGLPKINK